jgi:hypothetical protein
LADGQALEEFIEQFPTVSLAQAKSASELEERL